MSRPTGRRRARSRSPIVLTNARTTLIERLATAVLADAAEQAPHLGNFAGEFVELGEFCMGRLPPPFRGAGTLRKAAEELPNLVEGEAETSGPLHNGELIQHAGVVTSLPADSMSFGQEPDALVVPNRGWRQTCLTADF